MLIEKGDEPGRRDFLGIGFDPLTLTQTVSRLRDVTPDIDFRYIVTPNVDHVVRLSAQRNTPGNFVGVYQRAAYCLCDSRILALIARYYRVTLPVVPGSDLTAALFASVIAPGDVIAIVGGDEEMIEVIRTRHPGISILHHQPPMGLRHDPDAMATAAAFAAASRARFIFLAVGSPQQELLAQRIAERAEARGMALCIGASIEFISGHQKRAPVVVQRMGLEWVYRLLGDPARLWRRYLVEGPKIFGLARAWSTARDEAAFTTGAAKARRQQ